MARLASRLRVRLLLTVFVPIAVLIGTILVVRGALVASVHASERVLATTVTISDANALLHAAVDAETGVRGFLLTGREAELEPYNAALPDFERRLAHLRDRTATDATQTERLDELAAAFASWRENAAEPFIAARRVLPAGGVADALTVRDLFASVTTNEPAGAAPPGVAWRRALNVFERRIAALRVPEREAATRIDLRAAIIAYREAYLREDREPQELRRARQEIRAHLNRLTAQAALAENEFVRTIASGSGRAYMDHIRAVTADLVAEEDRRLAERFAVADMLRRRARVTVGVGIALGLAVAAAAAGTLVRSVLRGIENVHRTADALASGQLDARTEPHGVRELRELALHVNALAGRMQRLVQRERQLRDDLEERVESLVAGRAAESDALNELGDLLHAVTSEVDAHAAARRFARRLLPTPSGGLYLLDPARQHLSPATTWGDAPADEDPARHERDGCWALRRGKEHVVSQGEAGLRCSHMPPTGAAACVPLVAHGEALGVLMASGAAAADAETHRRARLLADRLAVAYANLRLRETLREQSLRDPLTGLFNRRHMEASLERELERAARANTPLTLALLDIDRFKRFNDRHGHGAGDAVLRTLGRMLGDGFRGQDVVCRYGGEELIVILPDADATDAAARLRAFQDRLATTRFEHGHVPLGPVTISAGVAAYPAHAAAADDLVAAADRALYDAKSDGRNRTRIATLEAPQRCASNPA